MINVAARTMITVTMMGTFFGGSVPTKGDNTAPPDAPRATQTTPLDNKPGSTTRRRMLLTVTTVTARVTSAAISLCPGL